MTEQQAMRMALEALESKFLFIAGDGEAVDQRAKAITALRQALEPQMRPATRAEKIVKPGVYEVKVEQQQADEPVAWMRDIGTGRRFVSHGTKGVYPDGQWVPLYKYRPPADELLRLRDLLGKANALARIRANEIESLKASLYGLYELEKQRDELQERLIKTEDQLGEAVWNYGELKREQLANQQKTSGSPIDSLTEPADEPVGLIESLKDAKPCCGQYETCWRACTPRGKFLGQRDAKREWVGLDRKEMLTIIDQQQANTSTGLPMFYRDQCLDIARDIEAALRSKNT